MKNLSYAVVQVLPMSVVDDCFLYRRIDVPKRFLNSPSSGRVRS